MNSEIVPFSAHQQWFNNCLKDKNCILLIGEEGKKAVGVIRYNVKGKEAMVSVYLVPGEKKTPGMGTELICTGNRWFAKNYPMVERVNAEIISSNIASVNTASQSERSPRAPNLYSIALSTM